MTDYIHYTKRQICTRFPLDICSPWYSELHDFNSKFDTPCFHITRQNWWPVGEVKSGDVIWLLSQLKSKWGDLLPSLDGKIVVGEIYKHSMGNGKVKYKFFADSNSRWFNLSDQLDTLKNLKILRKNGTVYQPLLKEKYSVGQEFQSIKRVLNPEILEYISDKIVNEKFDFVSYRVTDGTRNAFTKAKELLANGNNVFWDRWSLPRRLAERRELVNDENLESLILNKIREAAIVWGIESKNYAESDTYSNTEKVLALELNKYHPVKVK